MEFWHNHLNKAPHFCEYCQYEVYDKERQMVRCSLIEDSYKYEYDSEQRKDCPIDNNLKMGAE